MSLYPHAMLPDRTQDQKARQEFVKSFRAHLAMKIRSGLGAVYKARVKPGFEKEHGREPQGQAGEVINKSADQDSLWTKSGEHSRRRHRGKGLTRLV